MYNQLTESVFVDWIDFFTYGFLVVVIGLAVAMALFAHRREHREKAALKSAAESLGFSHGSNGVMGEEIKGEQRGRKVRAWWKISAQGGKNRLVIEVALNHPGWAGVWLGSRSFGLLVPLSSLYYQPPNVSGLPRLELKSERFNGLCSLRTEVSPAQRRALQSEEVLKAFEALRKISPRFQLVDDVIAVELPSPAAESGDVVHSSTSEATALLIQQIIETIVEQAVRLDDFDRHAASSPSQPTQKTTENAGEEVAVDSGENLW